LELILLGIDGAEPALVTKWASEGYLPNFARLIYKGAFGNLRSTIHPLTPQAWASIITGVGAGRHGIYDFGCRTKDEYDFELINSSDRAWPAFWELLVNQKKMGIVNVPISYPPDPVDGFFISGMHTPSIKEGVYPKGLEKELDDYVIDVMCHWYKENDEFLSDMEKMAGSRHKNILSLVKKYPVDILFPVYVAADRVQHGLWGYLTDKHLEKPGRIGDLGDGVFSSYRLMDDFLGDYIEMADKENAHLIVVSDHGFGDLKKDVYLNAVLAKEGFLFFDPEKVRNFTPRNVPLSQDPTHDWQRRAFPKGPAKLGDDSAIVIGDTDPRYKDFKTVDWKRTKAYSAGLFGNIWINLKGREPQGIIDSGKEYENLRDKISSMLLKVKDPEDNLPIVDRVYKKEELYKGPMTDMAPDLIVQMRDYAYITRGSTEFLCKEPVSPVVVNHTGNHRINGIIGLYGPDVLKGTKLYGSSVIDVVPTLLYIICQKIPAGLDGKVLLNAFTDDLKARRPVEFTGALDTRNIIPKGFSKKEKEIIEKRLKALGYLG